MAEAARASHPRGRLVVDLRATARTWSLTDEAAAGDSRGGACRAGARTSSRRRRSPTAMAARAPSDEAIEAIRDARGVFRFRNPARAVRRRQAAAVGAFRRGRCRRRAVSEMTRKRRRPDEFGGRPRGADRRACGRWYSLLPARQFDIAVAAAASAELGSRAVRRERVRPCASCAAARVLVIGAGGLGSEIARRLSALRGALHRCAAASGARRA